MKKLLIILLISSLSINLYARDSEEKQKELKSAKSLSDAKKTIKSKWSESKKSAKSNWKKTKKSTKKGKENIKDTWQKTKDGSKEAWRKTKNLFK